MEENQITARKLNNQDKRKNKGWEENHAAIVDAYVRLIAKLKRAPKQTEIKEEMARKPNEGETKIVKSLGLDTISKHCAELSFEPLSSPLRILTDRVLIAIANSAMKGQAASQKLWLQVMEGWVEGMDLTSGGAPITESRLDLSKLTVEELVLWRALMERASPKKDAVDGSPDND